MEDNYERWARYDADREAQLRKQPKCDYCGEYIQEDHYFEVNDEKICPDCMDAHFRKWTEDYIE